MSHDGRKIVQNRSLSARRAWIEIAAIVSALLVNGSLSARRAWIEIPILCCDSIDEHVALRKESVDRNPVGVGCLIMLGGSLSARRAWIEMTQCKL